MSDGQPLEAHLARLAAGLNGRAAVEFGVHLTTDLGDEVTAPTSAIDIAARAAAHGLHVDPLPSHSVATPNRQGFLFGYAGGMLH